MKKTFIALLCGLYVLVFPVSGLAIDAVASIKRVTGDARVERGKSVLSVRKGLILYENDIVVTPKSSKVTIVFRDGSTIRLFPNTRFLIERSEETQSGSRQFINNLMLKFGSFWGKFTQRSQETVIHTPTVTCGIKGTEVALVHRDDMLTVSLAEGNVSLKNDSETVDLQPGYVARDISRSGPIASKIQKLPFRLVIKPDQNRLFPPESGKTADVFFSIQMVNAQSGENAFQTGPVYISHEFDQIEFESDIQLNDRGYARIRAKVYPFQMKSLADRQVEILAIMDGEEFINVEGGKTVLVLTETKRGQKKLRINAGTGRLE